MHSARSSSSYRFGVYVVDLRSGEVSKNGTRIRLQEKPLRVLTALMEHPGQLVTREELHRRLWADTTFVDFEVGLNTAVKKLRVALCDDAEEPRYIETIPRRGYRFICGVKVVENRNGEGESLADVAEVVPLPPTPAIEPSQSARANTIWVRAGLALLLLLVAFTLWWQTPLPDPKALQIFPITDSAKLDFLVRPAADGARIFYLQNAGDHYDLMQASVSGGNAQKMPTPFRNTVIWDVAPDNSHYLISSFAYRGQPAQLWSWPVTGGAPAMLGDMISGSATYSPDGKQIAFHIGQELWVGSADGLSKRKLRTFDGSVDDPAWSPDGERLRFTLKDARRDTSSIWEIGLDSRGLHQILADWTNPSRLCCGSWTPDGKYFLFVDTHARPSLWALREKKQWWRRSPRGPFVLLPEAEGTWSPLVGRDGRHLYFYSMIFQTELNSLDFINHKFAPLLPGLHAAWPSFSPDGNWIAFGRVGSLGLWRARADGTDLRELPLQGKHVAFPRWSPDGKTLAFSAQGEGTRPNIYVVDADGGQPSPLAADHTDLSDPDWSPDGSTLVVERLHFLSADEVESRLAFVTWSSRAMRGIPGSEEMIQPRWSPDGKWIAAVSGDRRELHLYDLAHNRWSKLVGDKSISLPVWSSDARYVYYQNLSEAEEPIRRVNISTAQAETVANFRSVLEAGVYRCVFTALTPDGRAIVNFDRSADIHGATLSLP